ncbi:unnamed protein product [Urochloa humidicola]
MPPTFRPLSLLVSPSLVFSDSSLGCLEGVAMEPEGVAMEPAAFSCSVRHHGRLPPSPARPTCHGARGSRRSVWRRLAAGICHWPTHAAEAPSSPASQRPSPPSLALGPLSFFSLSSSFSTANRAEPGSLPTKFLHHLQITATHGISTFPASRSTRSSPALGIFGRESHISRPRPPLSPPAQAPYARCTHNRQSSTCERRMPATGERERGRRIQRAPPESLARSIGSSGRRGRRMPAAGERERGRRGRRDGERAEGWKGGARGEGGKAGGGGATERSRRRRRAACLWMGAMEIFYFFLDKARRGGHRCVRRRHIIRDAI